MSNVSRSRELSDRITALRGRRDALCEERDVAASTAELAGASAARHVEAIEVVRIVGEAAQGKLRFHVQDLVTTALEAVFGREAYQFRMDFQVARNRTECQLWLDREDTRIHPLRGAGGGVADVTSFALRLAAWSMQTPRSRPLLVLDEPFRWLSRDLQQLASAMLRELCGQLGVQVVAVTHEQALIEAADVTYVLRKNAEDKTVVDERSDIHLT